MGKIQDAKIIPEMEQLRMRYAEFKVFYIFVFIQGCKNSNWWFDHFTVIYNTSFEIRDIFGYFKWYLILFS